MARREERQDSPRRIVARDVRLSGRVSRRWQSQERESRGRSPRSTKEIAARRYVPHRLKPVATSRAPRRRRGVASGDSEAFKGCRCATGFPRVPLARSGLRSTRGYTPASRSGRSGKRRKTPSLPQSRQSRWHMGNPGRSVPSAVSSFDDM